MGYRYIGSKARVADDIVQYIGEPKPNDGFFIDAFSGTGIIASKAADQGWKVKVNDMMLNAAIMSEARLISKEDVPFFAFGGYGKALEISKGILYRANEYAKQPNSAALLIIDELNRGPAIEVFGGSIVTIESDKRLGDDNTPSEKTQFFEIISPETGDYPSAKKAGLGRKSALCCVLIVGLGGTSPGGLSTHSGA